MTTTLSKGHLRSKTIQGIILTLISLVGLILGWAPELQEQITTDVTALMTAASVLVGLCWTLYGRIKANVPLGGLIKKP
jgi:hypothetical protein